MTEILKLTFESDWHIGSGAGIPGSLDRQVLRDSDGLPYIPGKTLTGILRDAAEWIAATKDMIESGQKWRDALLKLFGEQPESHGGNVNKAARAAAIGIGSAEYSEKLRLKLRNPNHKHLLPFLFMLQPGVKIDPQTGCSLKNHLFSTEKVRKGCILYAPLEIYGELGENEKNLLDEAIKAVRRIGGNRRRGGGKCSIERIKNMGSSKSNSAQALDLPGTVDSDYFVTLNYRLTTLQPVIVNKVTLGNVVETETIIPGNLLLNYFTNDLLGDFDREEMRSAIMNTDINISNFLPEIEGEASYPVPLSFGKVKNGDGIMNRLLNQTDEGIQVKDLRTGVVTVKGKKILYHSSGENKTLRAHNTVEDYSQRPKEEVGGLFFYEAIREEQKFNGTVKIKGSLWNRISDDAKERLIAGETKIGRSRKDEYGRVCLQKITPSQNLTEESLHLIKDKGEYLVVYLISDVLLRGESLEYSTRLEDLRNHLRLKLDLELTDVPESEWKNVTGSDGNVKRISPLGGDRGHCARTGRRESWHIRWTLPRPSLVYFQAGSVLLYKVENPGDWENETIQKVMNDGIGDRRAEGYGRVWINPPFLCGEGFDIDLPKSNEKNPAVTSIVEKVDTSELSLEDKEFVKLLETEYHKKRFIQAARQAVYNSLQLQRENKLDNILNLPKGDQPTASQFGGLREVAAFIRYGGNDLKLLNNWLRPIDRKTGKTTERKNWDKNWVEWFDDFVDYRGQLWTKLKSNLSLKEIMDNEALRIFGMCTFIDILCEAVFDEDKHQNGEKHKNEEKQNKQDVKS